MDWNTVIATVGGLLGGGLGVRLWSTRKERGDDYERLIKLYREEVERCNKLCSDLQQKLLAFMQENVDLKFKVDQQGDQIETMEKTIMSLEKQIESLKK